MERYLSMERGRLMNQFRLEHDNKFATGKELQTKTPAENYLTLI
jgi:hypothetical protein